MGDAQIIATHFKHMPMCMTAADIEQLQEIPVQQSVVVLVRTVQQEAVAARCLPPQDLDASNVFSPSKHILQVNVHKHNVNTRELHDMIQ